MKDSTLSWYEWRLAGLLPERGRLKLLQACLEDRVAAHAAWNDFLAIEPEPKRFFERADGALRGLLPFVESGLAGNHIEPGREFATYLRVAVVREELRDRIYRDVFRTVMTCLAGRVQTPVVLRGLALADDCYPVADRRHNHAINLLVREEDIETASRLLRGAGFPGDVISGAGRAVRHTHSSGLPITLQERLFEPSYLVEPAAAIRNRTQVVDLAGVEAAVLDPADHLLHICARAAYSSSRANLRWICDTVLLTRRRPHLDWATMVCNAAAGGLAFPLSLVLKGMRDNFTVPIPESVEHQLRNRHGLHDSAVRRTVHAIALECPVARRDQGGPRRAAPAAALRLALFRLLPSRDYVRWKYDVDGLTATSWRYLLRALRYLSRTLRSATRQAA